MGVVGSRGLLKFFYDEKSGSFLVCELRVPPFCVLKFRVFWFLDSDPAVGRVSCGNRSLLSKNQNPQLPKKYTTTNSLTEQKTRIYSANTAINLTQVLKDLYSIYTSGQE